MFLCEVYFQDLIKLYISSSIVHVPLYQCSIFSSILILFYFSNVYRSIHIPHHLHSSTFDMFHAWQEQAARLERKEITKEEYDQ